MQVPLDEHEVAPGLWQLTLNRPAVRNALDAELIAALSAAVARHAGSATTRVLLIAAAGSAFCAGADLNQMLLLGQQPRVDNLADAERLAGLLLALRQCPKPSIALVQGPAVGGGVGLVCACDLAVAAEEARFRLPEVQLGLVPAVISPYLLEAIGPRQARRYCLSGEQLSAAGARELGLVHEVVPATELAARGLALGTAIAAGGPQALAACKQLLTGAAAAGATPAAARDTARLLADLRAGPEAQAGIAAALADRAPDWR